MPEHSVSLLQDIVVVTGPTATGKSSLALAIAQRLSGEIINADSVQIYRGFDIGSSKPSQSDFNLLPHHLFSICDATEAWSAGKFIATAASAIRDIVARKKLPVVVGGSGLYIRALVNGLIETEEPSAVAVSLLEEKIRELIAAGIDRTEITPALHRWLQEIDAKSAAELHEHDSTRIRRALLVQLTSAHSVSELRKIHAKGTCQYRSLIFSLQYPREELYQRINQRVAGMFEAGLVEEVRQLRLLYGADAKPFEAIGYKQLLAYLSGELEETAAREQIARDTRRFAKRQMTWWRNQPEKLGWQVLPELSISAGDLQEKVSDIIVQFRDKSELFEGVGPFYSPLYVTS